VGSSSSRSSARHVGYLIESQKGIGMGGICRALLGPKFGLGQTDLSGEFSLKSAFSMGQ